MSIPRRLVAFAGFARAVGGLAPSRAGRLRNLAVTTYLLARQYVPRLPRRTLRLAIAVHGRPFAVTVDAYPDVDVVHELFVRGEYGTVELPDEAGTIVDLGANIGLSALEFRARYPRARIVACEPDPGAFSKLATTTADDPGIEVHNVAIAEEDGERMLYTSDWAVLSSFHNTRGGQDAVPVRAITLATLFDEAGLERVDLLKIDVEGAEWDVLQGIEPGDWPHLRQLVLEVHDVDGRADRVRALLERQGYRVTVEAADWESMRLRGMCNVFAVRD